jgi:nucleoside-diphosphate-sugar epimerase
MMLLITGITGHSGKYFLEELSARKYDGKIRCIIRETSDRSILDHCGLDMEVAVGDLSDSGFLHNCMQDVDAIFHIAGIWLTLDVLKAATNAEVKTIYAVHTTGVFSKYKSASADYLSIENTMHKIIDEKEIRVIILRPTMIYGDMNDLNMSKFIRMIDKFRFFPIIDHGKSHIQPVNARDLGKAYYQVLTTPTDTLKPEYILSGDKPVSMLQTFNLISDNLHKKTCFISLPVSAGVWLARALKIVSFGKYDYIEKIQRMGEDRSFSHEDAWQDFGYCPLPFEEGIKLEVSQFMNRQTRKG